MFAANVGLTLTWSLMNERFTLQALIMGFVFSYILLWFLQPLIGRSVYFAKVWQIARFLVFFVKELLQANVRVAWHVVTPSSFFHPGIVAVPLEDMSDLEASFLANTITLTPGSFSIDLSSDRKVLYVHVMDVDDPDNVRREIKEHYEAPLLEVMR